MLLSVSKKLNLISNRPVASRSRFCTVRAQSTVFLAHVGPWYSVQFENFEGFVSEYEINVSWQFDEELESLAVLPELSPPLLLPLELLPPPPPEPEPEFCEPSSEFSLPELELLKESWPSFFEENTFCMDSSRFNFREM